ncbi:hypothetical protein RMSM_07214 [Rhodopirellula maiorica SM1]|uniref:Uncharacterized protein n=1 Tax=Rhodopirellula maiorica SM1 TaxID=1265738 RepID=M5R9Z7_9BACT|nr:hypothetical protein RMSM_07214 [Rhodopirellula maiorica SM1]
MGVIGQEGPAAGLAACRWGAGWLCRFTHFEKVVAGAKSLGGWG